MGQPVVHFEVIGKDGKKLINYYSELFGWEIDANNPMNYGIVTREGNVNSHGVGIGGGVGPAPPGTRVTSPSTWRFPMWRRRWPRRSPWAASGSWARIR